VLLPLAHAGILYELGETIRFAAECGWQRGELALHCGVMNSRVNVESVSFFSDARGWVIEPVDEALLVGKRNVHVVFSEPGAIRGNHYHERTTEVFVVVGPALIRVLEDGALRDFPVPEGQAMRFTVPPGIAHAIQNTGPRPMILMSFAARPHDRTHPDTVPAVLIEK